MFCLHLYKFWIYDEKKKHDLKECKNIMEKRREWKEYYALIVKVWVEWPLARVQWTAFSPGFLTFTQR